MNGDRNSEGDGKHPAIPQEATLGDRGAERLAGSKSKGPDGGEIKSSVRRRVGIEIATLVVLTFTLFAAGYTAYEGSLLSNATGNLVKTNADTAHRELRAYVGVIPGGVENFGDSRAQRLTIIRRNYGVTPAYNVFVKPTLAAVMRAGDAIPQDEIDTPKLSGLLTLFPGISLPFYVTGTEGVAKDQADLVKEGKNVLFVYAGILTYNDAFGDEHYTRYCWLFKGPSMTDRDAEWCPGHNDSN
jgi:hypothetical protein